MPVIVELAGPTGIGKSSHTNRLWHREIDPAGSFVAVAPEIGVAQPRNAATDRLLRARSVRHFVERNDRLHRRLLRKPPPVEAYYRLAARHPEFFDVCLSAGRYESRSAAYVIQARRLVFTTLRDHALAREAARDDAVILFEEGLVQRALTILDPGVPPALRTAYFETMPPVEGVVLLCAPPEVVTERVTQRTRTAHRHRGVGHEDLVSDAGGTMSMFLEAAEILSARGIPVLKVDVEEPIEVSVEQIRSFLLDVASQARRPSDGATP